jgi:hypothetical protein
VAVNIPVVTKYDPSGLRRANKGFASFGKQLKGLVGPALAAAGFTSLAAGITSSVKAAAEDAKSQRLLARQLVTTTKASKKQVAGVEKFIDKTSMSVGIVDDELRPAFANLVRGTGSVSKAQKLLTIALDGSAASGKPLSAVTQALIKAQNGQLGGLYKLAPELKKTKGNLDDYAKSVTGAAEAAADPFAKLTVMTDNLSEKFGTILLPYVEEIVNFLITDVAPVVDKFLSDISNPKTEVGQYWQQLTDALGKVFVAVDKLLKSKVTQFLLDIAGKVVIGALEVLTITLNKLAAAFGSLNDAMETYNVLTGQKKAPKLGTSENAKASQQILENLGGTLGINFMDLVKGFTPKFANGGVVMPKVGGSLATVAEAGQPEAIIPLNRLSEMMGGSGGNVYNISIQNIGSGSGLGQVVVDAIKGYERSNGTGWRR